jgi:hypothetical protein
MYIALHYTNIILMADNENLKRQELLMTHKCAEMVKEL